MAGSDISAYYSVVLSNVALDGTTALTLPVTWAEETRSNPFRSTTLEAVNLGRIPLLAFTRSPAGSAPVAPYGARLVARSRGLSSDARVGVIPYQGNLPAGSPAGQEQPLRETPSIGMYVMPGDEIYVRDPTPARDARIDFFLAPANNRETDTLIEFWTQQTAIINDGPPPPADFTFVQITAPATPITRTVKRTLVTINLPPSNAVDLPALADTEVGDTFEIVNLGSAVELTTAEQINGVTVPQNSYMLPRASTVVFVSTGPGGTWITHGAPSIKQQIINAATTIEPFRGRLYVGVALAAGADITLPSPLVIPENAEIMITRTGGLGVPALKNPAGVINGQPAFPLATVGEGVILRPVNNAYISTSP